MSQISRTNSRTVNDAFVFANTPETILRISSWNPYLSSLFDMCVKKMLVRNFVNLCQLRPSLLEMLISLRCNQCIVATFYSLLNCC
jgi:hypothetical protein